MVQNIFVWKKTDFEKDINESTNLANIVRMIMGFVFYGNCVVCTWLSNEFSKLLQGESIFAWELLTLRLCVLWSSEVKNVNVNPIINQRLVTVYSTMITKTFFLVKDCNSPRVPHPWIWTALILDWLWTGTIKQTKNFKNELQHWM